MEKAKAIVNGIVGDHLDETDNELATVMAFYDRPKNGNPIALSSLLFDAATPPRRLCIFMHGLTDNESVWATSKHCPSYGDLLAEDAGVTCVYLRYNTGLHISTNGRRLCELLDEQLQELPSGSFVVTFICHSMGGLVTRSACLHAVKKKQPSQQAGSSWVHRVGRIIFLGTPHHGSYWEQLGNVMTSGVKRLPYVGEVVADVANKRSAGIKDLRYGYLQDEDWQGQDPDAYLRNDKRPAELLPWIDYYVASGLVTKNPHNPLSHLLGDALVGRDSAQGKSKATEHSLGIPPENMAEFPGVGHIRLTSHRRVYEQIRQWMDRSCRAVPPALPLEAATATRTTDAPSLDETPHHIMDRCSDTTTRLPPTTTTSTWAQAKGATTLLETAVDRGTTAVEAIQDKVTKQVYDVIAVVVPGARTVESIHTTISKGIFGSIRLINGGVGAAAKFTFSTLDDCSKYRSRRRARGNAAPGPPEDAAGT